MSEGAELIFSCVKLGFNGKVNDAGRKETLRALHGSIKDLIEDKYQKMLAERM